jgi:hypothetical protein
MPYSLRVWPRAGAAQQIPCGELVGQPRCQWGFASGHGQINPLARGEIGQRSDVVRVERHTLGRLGDAGIAGRTEETRAGTLFAAPQRPAESVFAPARPDDENLHKRITSRHLGRMDDKRGDAVMAPRGCQGRCPPVQILRREIFAGA